MAATKGKSGKAAQMPSNLSLEGMGMQPYAAKKGEEYMGANMIEHVTDRLGHDRRYAIDGSKIRQELNWQPSRSAWPQALENTVRWYQEHEDWWHRVKSGAYRDYYQEQYEKR